VAVVGLVGAGCGDDDDDGAEEAATTEAEAEQAAGGPVTIVADDYVFTDVPQLTAGVIDLTLDNQGQVAHEVALAEIGDTPLDQFLEDFPPVLEGGPFPDYVEAVAVPLEAEPGASGDITFTLTEGDYALFCTFTGAAPEEGATTTTSAEGEEAEPAEGPPHYELGMAQAITVGPGEADTALPEADGTIAARDYEFETDIEAGDTVVNFTNDGPAEVHFASVSVFPEGTDAATAQQAFATLLAAPEDAPPPEGVPVPEDVGFSGVFSAGLSSSFQLQSGQFESGRTYLLACFIQDRAGGPPHAVAYNMYTAFTVP
jgi:hypothetical protein